MDNPAILHNAWQQKRAADLHLRIYIVGVIILAESDLICGAVNIAYAACDDYCIAAYTRGAPHHEAEKIARSACLFRTPPLPI